MRRSLQPMATVTLMIAISCNSPSTTATLIKPSATPPLVSQIVATPTPKVAETVPPPHKALLPEKVIIDGTVLKSISGKLELAPRGMKVLDGALEKARSTGLDFRVMVSGYSSTPGSRARNMAISRHRAEFIEKVLAKAGIPPEKITLKVVGPDYPVADNGTQAGRWKNRRVEIEFLDR